MSPSRGVVRVRDRHSAPTTVSVYVFETETARHSILDMHCLPAPETQTEAGPHSTRHMYGPDRRRENHT